MAIESDPATITAVVGESGSGKTTLARLLFGAIAPTTGTILYKGQDLQKLSKSESRAFLTDVQVIFQDPFEVYNPFYRVEHVLTMPIDYLKLANSNEQKWNMIEEALETVGLRAEETIGRYPHQLSGGQRQRVMVARAMIIKPSIILADEPASMIDASLRATVLGSLLRLKTEFGISIVYITHDLATAFQIGDNIIVMYRGSVAEVGGVEGLSRSRAIPTRNFWWGRCQIQTRTSPGEQKTKRPSRRRNPSPVRVNSPIAVRRQCTSVCSMRLLSIEPKTIVP
jgi:peptide/nickel transport system ATP-binding protein